MKSSISEIKVALKALKIRHTNKQEWLKWFAQLEQVAKNLNCSTSDDLSDDVSDENFKAVGFSQAEADAFVFVMTQDCMGQSCTSVEMIERYFCYEL
jgi:hypothetical protein